MKRGAVLFADLYLVVEILEARQRQTKTAIAKETV